MRPLRMSWVFLSLLIILLFKTIPASEIKKIIEKTKELYGSSKDFEMHFRQKTSSDFFSKTDSVAGEILIKRPDRFILRQPRQEILYDGDILWIHNKKDNQVLKSRSYGGAPFDPEEFLRNLNYECKLVGSDKVGGHNCYVISSDSLPQMGILNLILWIDKENYWVRKLSYRDNVDNQVEFLFDSIEFDTGLKEEDFKFAVPSGVEVIDW